MPISPNFTSVYSKDWEINFIQCYPNGQLKYTELCNILQLTAGYHAELGGLSFSDMQLHQQAWVLSRMRVEVIELPKWRDIVTVKTWIVDMQGSRSVRALELYVGETKMASSLTYWVVLNTELRKPEALALPFEHFDIFPENLSTKKSFAKINLNLQTRFLKNKTVLLSDLDIVNHANNVKYLEWCLDLVDEKLILKQGIKSFEMNFLKELSLKDKVVIHENSADETTIFSITKEEKTSFALQLNWK